ncbi:hypothetical protein EKO27_g4440 [Xylaria grammica]|uniref:F-box domain-containing protein n=1 Tax=Xylaria grammica TaxID=363999 RepID=A0A439D8D4_9PEZI|nr:hypothetical protein EKO27_g4440 [Xylaria grammica]
MICRELGDRREFTTLYHFSTVSRRVASIAVEQLYGILEVSDSFIYHTAQAARLWRSIILSSLGATTYPYCAYIRALSLGSLVECLYDIRSDRALRNFFFEGLMQDFLVLQGDGKSAKSTLSRYPPFDNPRITSRCADSIIQYIKRLADSNGTAIALTHLEASVFPRDILPTWLSRLGSLTSLQIQDGEVTLAALNIHAESLKVLDLRSLLASTVKSLHVLSPCTALERLLIEREATDTSGLDILNEEELAQVTQWITSCRALRELSFNHVQDALPILKQVLQTPDIRLEQLAIQDYRSLSREITRATWCALGKQDRLNSLTIASPYSFLDELVLPEHPELTDSICYLSNMTALNLMQTSVSSTEICRIATALPRLEELSFGGGLVDDSILDPLCKLPKLTTLSINAVTAFTFDNLWVFAQRLHQAGCRNIRFELLNQWYETKLTESEETQLTEYFIDYLKGQIAITYPNDPDELHEADFSDSD